MSINSYLEKLRAKPRKERERIAVIATAVSFLVIVLIWIASLSDMRQAPDENGTSLPVGNQLQDLKSGLGSDRQSIEEMMKDFSAPQDNSFPSAEGSNQNQPVSEPQNGIQSEGNNQGSQPVVPQLP